MTLTTTLESGATSSSLADLQARLASLENKVATNPDKDTLNMVVFSGDLDKMLAAFVIAVGAGACGMKVHMFFTFWGTAALKKSGPQSAGKSLVERMFGTMLPGGLHRRRLSQLDMFGMGRAMLRREMRTKNISDLPTLIDMAKDCGVAFQVCEMSMNLMGITTDELIELPSMEICGVAKFLEHASEANTTLFV